MCLSSRLLVDSTLLHCSGALVAREQKPLAHGDLLSSFDPLTGALGSAGHSDGAARVQLPDKVAAAFAAPAQSTVATLTPEQQREQMMRAVQEDAQRMHQQCGKGDVEDPFKGLEK
eukprot:s239_g15.t1